MHNLQMAQYLFYRTGKRNILKILDGLKNQLFHSCTRLVVVTIFFFRTRFLVVNTSIEIDSISSRFRVNIYAVSGRTSLVQIKSALNRKLFAVSITSVAQTPSGGSSVY